MPALDHVLARGAKVADLGDGLAIELVGLEAVEQHIGRFDVSVDHRRLLRVQVDEASADAVGNVGPLFPAKRRQLMLLVPVEAVVERDVEELEHEGCPPAVAKGRLLASALYASLGQDPPAEVKAEAAHPPDEHAKISLI